MCTVIRCMYQGGKLDTKMRSRSRTGAVIAFASLMFVSVSRGQEVSSVPPSNDAIVHHMEELELQVKELRAEVATLKEKDNDKSATTTALPAPAQSNLVSSAASTSSTPSVGPPSLAGLLGPTTLSGFVDIYYGQNFNNPASQTNS